MYKDVQLTDEQKSAIPIPRGYKLLLAVPRVEEITKGGIHLPDNLVDAEHVASVVGFVVAMGDLAYRDEKKFPTGPWCNTGDYVIVRAYSGTRIKIADQELRLVNDDSIEAVVDDPRKITRAF